MNWFQRFPSRPESDEGFPDGLGFQRQVCEELTMVPAIPVIWWPAGRGEDSLHKLQVEVEQEGAVEEQSALLPPLGVA